MYGRESAGHRLTSATYQPADTTIVAAPTSSLPMRFHIPTGAATRNASAETGHDQERLQHLRQERKADGAARQRDPASACSLGRPHHAVRGSHEQQHQQRVGVVEPEHQAPPPGSAPAPRPRSGPRPVRCCAARSHTAVRRRATPISASGSSIVNALKPNSLPNKPITHSAAGGLSTVIALPASSEPNSHAFQSCVPACAAAA